MWLRHARTRVFERPYFYGGVALALVAAWMLFGGNGNNAQLQTLVVEPREFAPAVSVTGTVVAAQEVDLGFAQSGRVSGVYATVGSRVAQGTTIANIENGDERAAVQSAEARLAEARAGTRPEEVHIAEVALASAKASAVDEVQDAFRAADDAVRTKTAELFNNPATSPRLTFITERVAAKRDAEAGRLELEHTLDDWERELAGLTASSNITAAIVRAQQVLAEVAPFLTAVSNALNAAEVDAYNTQAEIDAYVADIASARASISSAQSGLTAARADIEAEQKALDLKRAGSTSYDISYEEAQVAAARAQLARTIIAAPFTGTVSRVDVSVGEIVSPNTPEISMISDGVFQIESYIPEVNIAAVSVGDKAVVTLDAFGVEEFTATVVSIDPAETLRDNVSTYKTTLQFAAADARIRSGLTANVSIATDIRPNALVVPLGAIVRRDSRTFVQVLVGNKPAEREVVLGVQSLGLVEVTQGLAAGDTVVLSQ